MLFQPNLLSKTGVFFILLCGLPPTFGSMWQLLLRSHAAAHFNKISLSQVLTQPSSSLSMPRLRIQQPSTKQPLSSVISIQRSCAPVWLILKIY